MNLRRLTQTWEQLGREDPLWAVVSAPERRAGRWDPAEFFATGAEEVAQLAARARQLGLPWGGGRALDFGCGVGRITQALGAHFPRVDGVDISEPMLAQARRFNARTDACHYTCNVRPDLAGFADGTFDFIYSRIVLQHMPPRLARRYLAEFCRILRPGGTLFFQMPAGWNTDSPLTYDKLRHHVTIPRGIYKTVRRVVMLDWFRGAERRPPRDGTEMEMHFTSVPRVLRQLDRLGLRLVEASRDDACGEMIDSYHYFATKPERPPARLHSRWAWRRITRPE